MNIKPSWTLFVLLTVSIVLAIPMNAKEIDSVESAINKAGRQRMLSQRIAKAYCQLGMSISPQKASDELASSIELFESQLRELQHFSTGERVSSALSKVDVIWWTYKRLASSPPTREASEDLYYLSDELLFAADMVVRLLQDQANHQVGELVNVSGRQRMLSQRLAKLYLIGHWSMDVISVPAEIDKARREFTTGLARLKEAPQNTPAITARLDEVSLQWEWFSNVLARGNEQASELIVLDASSRILALMEQVTSMYEELE